ncbi:imidazolonepropionase [Halostella pelagica]|uniref:imidazolonepropionase n=1 Tax=Halostella pelagica TaxID=2583824 RepID=UPI0010809CBD|nr:imidazolonepropionase [Halostella pelagica]
MSGVDAVVYDAREVVVGPDEAESDGTREGSDGGSALDVRERAAVVVDDGRVVRVGDTDAVTREYPPENADRSIDAAGQAVVPGFVDPHTHAVFAGDRSDEFAAKLRGKPYQEILAEGGGILRTVRSTREASDETLLANLLGHLDAMLDHGSTTVEVKSGYGLDTDTELRLLDAVRRADERHPVDVVPTFMGAHAVPEGQDGDDYVDRVVEDQIPAVADQGVAEFCDVFCEEDVFSVEQSRRVLEAGRAAGMTPKVHAEEFTHLGGAGLAADVDAASADHLLHASAEDARALAESDVVPVLLPGTAFGLGADYADPQPFREAGAPVALATDFNPNCFSRSQGFTATLACVEMGMTPADALLGVTRNAALSLSRDDGSGTLREGAPGDLVVLDAPSHVHVPYRFDGSPVDTVLKDGVVVRD